MLLAPVRTGWEDFNDYAVQNNLSRVQLAILRDGGGMGDRDEYAGALTEQTKKMMTVDYG